MNPLRLSLQNFLCYRGRVGPISFEGFQLACLCGDNGVGKSALLDAITWALWGQARGQGDDALVHAGEQEMEVELDFNLRSQSYRVIRKHIKGSSRQPGRSLLELQLIIDQGYRSLGRHSLRDTQRYLEAELLHMDYDTFINSAFLLQGRANEFTTGASGHRKDVLAQVLGLSLYDELESQAKALREERKVARQGLSLSLEQLQAELEQRPEHEREKLQAEAELIRLDEELSRQETMVNHLRQHLERLRLQREHLAQLERDLGLLTDRLTTGRQEVAEIERQVQGLEGVQGQRQQIETGYTRYLKAKRMETELSDKGLRLRPLERRKAELEQALREAQSQIEKEKAVLNHRLLSLQRITESSPQLEKQMAEVHSQIAHLETEQASLESTRSQAQELLGQLQRLSAFQEQLERQRGELAQKKELMLQGDGRCPLCGTELGPGKRHDLQAEYESQEQALALALAAHEQEREKSNKQHHHLLALIRNKEAELAPQRQSALSQSGTLQAQIEQAQKATQEVALVQAQLTEVDAQLSLMNWAAAPRQELAQVEAEIKSLGYDPKQYQAARQEVDNWQRYQTMKSQLEEAEKRLSSVKASLDRARLLLQGQLGQWEQKGGERERLSQELSTLTHIEGQTQEAEAQLRSLKGQREQVQRNLGAVEANLRRYDQLEEQSRELRARQALLAEEEAIYDELTTALGKGGVQALLIEQVLPQLAAEADSLLKRLTQNRMSLDFRTQRLTKKGAAVETLDVIIGDELGTRSYEMYSGGEAFRIDFALRVAIARLVARRAGAPLSLLVIDEGFGTQDTEGRERLVEAINTVAQDFDKVIVVTHMEELKERFASRIEVTKNENGSRVEVLA